MRHSNQAQQQQMQGGAPHSMMTPQNKVFQLNKQLILTCRKLETGPLENYTHMATLIHKVNLLLLEYDSITQMKNVVNIIYTDKLLNTVIDFCMNTESFANFGIRLIEILSLEFPHKIARSEVFQVIQGLLRTNDYETVAQCLSFVSVMSQQITVVRQTEELVGKSKHEKLVLEKIVTPRLLQLILITVSKQPNHAQIEFVHYSLEIVSHCVLNQTLREAIIQTDLPGLINMRDEIYPQTQSEKVGETTENQDQSGQNTQTSSQQMGATSKGASAEGSGQNSQPTQGSASAPNESDIQEGDKSEVADQPPVQKFGYIEFLSYLEKQDQFRSVPKLAQRITRQRKELEMWRTGKEMDIQRQKQAEMEAKAQETEPESAQEKPGQEQQEGQEQQQQQPAQNQE